MKNLKVLAVSMAFAAVATSQAVVFNDPTGDINVIDAGHTHLDLTSVEVTNTLSTITFKFNVAGNPTSPNWGKYAAIIRRSGGGDLGPGTNPNGPVNNPWGRGIFLNGGANAWVAGWADNGAPPARFQAWSFVGNWSLQSTNDATVDSTSYSLTANLADLGIAVGETITFDAITTGGGDFDTARDSLFGAESSSWSSVVNTNGGQYTVVPEPASMAALGLAALAMLRKRKAAK